LHRHLLVRGELPDHVGVHDMLEPEAAVRAARDRRSPMVFARSGFEASAERGIEIAFNASDRCPASMPWLFEAAVQAKISFVIPFLKRARPNFIASRVAFVFKVTRAFPFWMNDPKHIISAISAMFESI